MRATAPARQYDLSERGWALARQLGMTTPEEVIGLVSFATEAVESGSPTAAGLDLEGMLGGLLNLVELGYLEWRAEECAFAMTLPGLGDTGGRVPISVPRVEEVNEA
jgi:hypothetical protein